MLLGDKLRGAGPLDGALAELAPAVIYLAQPALLPGSYQSQICAELPVVRKWVAAVSQMPGISPAGSVTCGIQVVLFLRRMKPNCVGTHALFASAAHAPRRFEPVGSGSSLHQ